MPTNRRRRLIYWDTNVFLSWIKNESRGPGIMEGMESMVRRVHAGEVELCSSVITKGQIFRGSLDDEQKRKLDGVFKRRNVHLINVDDRISTLCGEIREHYNRQGMKITWEDGTHLATAIIYRCDEFNTFDGSGHQPRRADLIPLSGNVAGRFDLLIRAPQPVRELDLFTKRDDRGERG